VSRSKAVNPSAGVSRRRLLRWGVILPPALLAGGGAFYGSAAMRRNDSARLPSSAPQIVRVVGGMPYRRFGRTGLELSEVGFGAWGIGGASYGAVDRAESLRALARAEELGCNFVDTARVYGNSEEVLGEFLRGRRDRWVVATKYSRKNGPMTQSLEVQLRRLGTSAVDLYQIHWAPRDDEQALYEEIYRLKKAGKTRFVGVSLDSLGDIDYVLDRTQIDAIQLPFSLLDPTPFLDRAAALRRSGLGVIVRSSLKEGFLTGKFNRDSTFPDPADQRHSWTREQIARTVDLVERYRFLEADAGSLARAAVSYPLSYPEVSTVILGTKSVRQAESNFGLAAGGRLPAAAIARIGELQRELGLVSIRSRVDGFVRALLGR
jgi:myo-inositol catabolism protein IolS